MISKPIYFFGYWKVFKFHLLVIGVNITYNGSRLVFRWQIQHQAITNIYKSLNFTTAFQKYHKTCHLKQTDVAHSIIFSELVK